MSLRRLSLEPDGDANGVRGLVAALRAERRKRLQKSLEQVDEFIALMNNPSLSRNILHGETIPLKLLAGRRKTS